VFAFVILRNKAMLKFSTYFFLMVMSIADTLVLYAGLLPIWIGQLINGSLQNPRPRHLCRQLGRNSSYTLHVLTARVHFDIRDPC